MLIGVLLWLAPAGAAAVTTRHDLQDALYLQLAQSPPLAPGLVVTRPFAETPGSGVLIHPRCVLTAGHIGSIDGPADMPVTYLGNTYNVNYVHLFPAFRGKKDNWGGYDLAVLQLKGEGIRGVAPAVVWTRGVAVGQRFFGVGQGKSGTGRQNDEPIPSRTFRGYENTIDHLFDPGQFLLLVADFDAPDGTGNTLADTLFHPARTQFQGRSSPQPLPLEGALAAGDSGSGIWAAFDGQYYLIGIATFRTYSCYGGQSYYVNLSQPAIAAWIASACPGVSRK